MSTRQLNAAVASALVWLACGCDQGRERPERPGAPTRAPQLGDVPGSARPIPPAVLPPPEPVAGAWVALGDFHSCSALDGKVTCRGSNVYQQLGVASPPGHRRAAVVPGVTTAVRVAAGAKHSCALLRDGTVVCWGLDQFGQTGHDGRDPAPVDGLAYAVDLALGAEHSCALIRDGTVSCWGRNSEGQLGSAANDARGRRPGGMVDPLQRLLPARNAEPRPVQVVGRVVQVAAGDQHTCARTAQGTVWCWGANDEGQLGLGVMGEPSRTPRAVPAVMSAKHIAAGGNQSCAALADGSVRCWGSYAGSFAVPHEPHPWPVRMPDLDDVKLIDVGPALGCATSGAGRLSCWQEGPLSDGHWYDLGHPPQPVDGAPEAMRLAVGLTATCITQPDHQVVCWGRNPYGMISSSDAKRLRVPAPYGAGESESEPPDGGAAGDTPDGGGQR